MPTNSMRPPDPSTDSSPSPHPGAARPRRWRFSSVAGLAVLALLICWRPLHYQCLTYFLVRAEAPSPEVLAELVQGSRNPKTLLLRLWRTQRLPHRRFVLDYLGRALDSQPDLFHALEPVLVEATQDVDHETRRLALEALNRSQSPQARSLALAQLGDADPAVRLLGLQSLRHHATSNDVPVAFDRLSDPDPRVVVAAGLVLRQATGQDFGLRLTQALPNFAGIGTNPPSPPDLEAIRQGVRRWRDWWKDHQAEFPSVAPSLPPARRSVSLPAPDFRLADAAGKSVRLADYRGKVLLLAFWSPDVPARPEEVTALTELQRERLHETAVVGICVPPALSCAEEHEHGSGGEHHHHHGDASSASSPASLRDVVPHTVQDRPINFPLLLDSEGTVGARFAVEDVPLYVLIDAQGRIRRTFPGSRAKPVLAAMFDETALAITR